MASENIYWLFSSSAQAIATFVAFLLTGFTLVLQMMDSLQEKDDTLQSIHDELKKSYHKTIVILVVLTGVSIILSLVMTYLNGLHLPWIGWAGLFTFLLNVVVISFAIWFVARIINPSKYGKTAKQLYAIEVKQTHISGHKTSTSEFFDSFVQLESEIRSFLQRKNLYQPSIGQARMSFSIRQMIETLYHNEYINSKLYQELLELNKIRNLVFHGHKKEIDSGFIQTANSLHQELKVIFANK